MPSKFKEFLLSFKFGKRKIIAFLFLFLVFGLFLPLHQAKAIAWLAALGIGFLVLIVVQLLVLISNLMLGFAGAVLSWVLSGNFITLPYTHGPVVETSWGLVRDLTNMLFIIVLIFIGLATALRIREYEAKKTLPLLIIIGLLINFTPVICGFIVDAANIVMNFFAKNITGGNVLGAQLFNQFNSLKGTLFSLEVLNPLEHLSILFRSLTLIIFNFIAAFILFAFAFLFVIRYVAIWVLVILSPLAFFSYILPATRRIWTMWWNQFIQWTLIGVTGAFFLYLGMQTLNILISPAVQQQLGTIPTDVGWLEKPFIEFLNQLLPYGIGIVFLLLAFFMGLSTGAMGGSQIIGLAKTGGKAAGAWAGTRGYQATLGRWLAGQARERAPGEKPSLMQRMATTTWKEAKWWERAATIPFAGPVAFWGTRRLGQLGLEAGAGRMQATIEGERDKIKKKYGRNFDAIRQSFSRDLPQEEQIARGLILAEEGYDEFNKLPIDDQRRFFDLTYKRFYPGTKDILRANPKLVFDKGVFGKMKGYLKLDGKDVTTADEAFESIMTTKVRAKDVEKLDRDFFLEPVNPETGKADPELGRKIREVVARRWGPEYWSAISRTFDEEVFKSLEETMKKLGAGAIAQKNARLLRAAITSPALRHILPRLDGAKTMTEIDALMGGPTPPPRPTPSPPPRPSPPPPRTEEPPYPHI